MTTAIEYALLAGASYYDTRADINRFPVPTGWEKITNPDSHFSDTDTGFEAISFTNGTEIVISFAGTGPLGSGDWWNGNIPLASGNLSDQLRQAADYYLQIKNDPANAGKTITFTGHSLGGGLASLMAVMFGESAFTFDQAPFRNAARTYSEVDNNTGETIFHSASRDLRAYLAGKGYDSLLVKLDAYILATDPTNPNPNPADTLAAREVNVIDINVKGEILSYLPFSRIGSQIDIEQQNNMLISSVNLHSQALLTAFLQSDDASPQNQSLNKATFKLPDLLKMIFDDKLYYRDPNNKENPEENFLERLVKHEAGVQGSITADAMVTRFTADLWKLAQEGGMTLKDGPSSNDNYLSRALTAFAMQKYYEETTTSAGYKKELFTEITGGIQFDMADVSDTFSTAFANNEKLTLTDAKGFDLYLKYFFDNNLDFNNNFTVEEDALILSILPYMRDWYIQAGAGGMNATDALGRSAFIPHSLSLAEDKNTPQTCNQVCGARTCKQVFEVLGGTADDYLTGETGADLLVGNAANDKEIHTWRIAA